MSGYAFLRKQSVADDWKLEVAGGNGRKVFVNRMYEATEQPLTDPEWRAEAREGRTPVVETGRGGLEIATCTGMAAQDRHKHLSSTEAYTVLEGSLCIYLDDEGPFELGAGDEVVILPGTVHEIVRGGDMLLRVHAIACGGEADKYVQLEPAGEWVRWSELSREERRLAYRKQDQPHG